MRPSSAPLVLAAALCLLAAAAPTAPADEALPGLAELRADFDVEALAADGMRPLVERFETDGRAVGRRWDGPDRRLPGTPWARHLETWAALLDGLPYERFDVEARVDWLLLRQRIRYEQRRLELEATAAEEAAALLPFAAEVAGLHAARRDLVPVDPQAAAVRLDALAEEIDALRERVRRAEDDGDADADEAGASGSDDDTDADDAPVTATRVVANRVAGEVRALRRTLADWYRHSAGYDPLFSWWCETPWEAADEALGAYARHLRETVAGIDEDDTDTLLGDPIGREALLVELGNEFLAYTPDELLAIAEAELAWCDARMAEAAAELGFGDDWRAAQEHVKGLHVEPGRQPELIRELAHEAVDFLEARELVTVPTLAKSIWRLEMMSPARQKYTPYFTGGEVISVAYPTAGMEHDDKLMALRGNNIHFSRATVHHELIPGHHLQGYMTQRYRPYRRTFNTPFWGEDWALYWEMLLWDAGFARSPEDRVGMLFWRKHRCARILFSLRFHLGELSPEECVDLLVERVGHERRNATAEVRRSIQGGYSPLYQAAYMLGGLQLRDLHRELVGSGQMTDRTFHDAVLRGGPIPIDLVRARLTGAELPRDHRASWRFADVEDRDARPDGRR